MHPIVFQIGNFTLRSYGLMAMFGFLTAWVMMRLNRRHAGLSEDQASNLLLLAMVSGIVGSRIFYVAMNWGYYSCHLSRIIRIDQGGLVFYGGFLLAMASIIVYSRKCKLDIFRVLDVFAPAMAAAHAWGRIGCFLNGCCFGKPTDCVFGIPYPAGSAPFLRYGDVPLHPVQLYEAGVNILIGLLMLVLIRKCKRGTAMAAYLAIYGVIRFADEFFRGDHRQFWNGLTPAQTIGLVMVPAGIGLMVWFARKARSADDAA